MQDITGTPKENNGGALVVHRHHPRNTTEKPLIGAMTCNTSLAPSRSTAGSAAGMGKEDNSWIIIHAEIPPASY